jgi:hypothetical protein
MARVKRGWTRRQVLALGAVTATAGCVGQPTPSQTSQVTTPRSSTPEVGETPNDPDTTAAGSPTGTTSTVPTAAPSDRPPVWQPDPNDVSPDAKATAAQHIQATVGPPPVEVIDAQYGGILANQASVLVVTHQWGGPASAGTTYDVRLDRAGTSWTVTQVLPSTPGTPSPPSAAARQVLADPNIALPPAARADINAGHVHDSVLNAMLALARTFRIGVSVVRSGHPTYVFGTARLSDHPFGRAFDTWRINDHPVVAATTPRTLISQYLQAVADTGSYNIGGPFTLPGTPYFTDATHHDHVHAGYLT